MYSRTYLSREDLETAMVGKISPVEINRILSAYHMADIAFADKKSLNGSPYFFHTSRVCSILLLELNIIEPDLIISSLLHDIFEANDEITPEIIEYNFGANVAFMLTILKEDYSIINKVIIPDLPAGVTLKSPLDDYLIISLAEHLDNFRSIEVSPMFNPINYILNTLSQLFPLAEQSTNSHVKMLMDELKRERNKILG